MPLPVAIFFGVLGPFIAICDLATNYTGYDNPAMDWIMILFGIGSWWSYFAAKKQYEEEHRIHVAVKEKEREEEKKKIVGLEYEKLLDIKDILLKKPKNASTPHQVTEQDRDKTPMLNDEQTAIEFIKNNKPSGW